MRYYDINTQEIMTMRKYWGEHDLVAMTDLQKAQVCGWYAITEIVGEEYHPHIQTQSDAVVTLNHVDFTASIEYTLTDIPLSEVKAASLQRIAKQRWEQMVGGLTLPSGVVVDTSEQSQSRITGMVAAINSQLLVGGIKFKTATGWVELTQAEALAVGGAVGAFVQGLYAAEFAKTELINDATTGLQVIEACNS